jgi:hypothetical protein
MGAGGGDAEGGEDCKEYTGGLLKMQNIEQLLRASFPQIDGEFIDDGPSENLRSRYRLRGGSLQILLEQNSWWVAWQATLEDGHAWTLEAEEGSTPAEAISNLQVAISQVRAIAEATEDVAKL